jgi:glycerophosphoryl diester phosphodiesterase
MLDRKAFLRPIAHRGLHVPEGDRIENTAPAFGAAIEKGYGIECDLRPAADGTPMVFHDLSLGRLIDARGRITDYGPADLARMRYKRADTRIMTLADLIDLVDARVPLLVEIKSEWDDTDPAFLKAIVKQAKRAKGPLALMSFDPGVMAKIKEAAPKIPRGIVSGQYKGDGWWLDTLDPDRAYRLTHLLESGPAAPSFYAYHVRSLPTPVTRFVRECLGLPLFTWTVRTPAELRTAEDWADAPIFEGLAL